MCIRDSLLGPRHRSVGAAGRFPNQRPIQARPGCQLSLRGVAGGRESAGAAGGRVGRRARGGAKAPQRPVAPGAQCLRGHHFGRRRGVHRPQPLGSGAIRPAPRRSGPLPFLSRGSGGEPKAPKLSCPVGRRFHHHPHPGAAHFGILLRLRWMAWTPGKNSCATVPSTP